MTKSPSSANTAYRFVLITSLLSTTTFLSVALWFLVLPDGQSNSQQHTRRNASIQQRQQPSSVDGSNSKLRAPSSSPSVSTLSPSSERGPWPPRIFPPQQEQRFPAPSADGNVGIPLPPPATNATTSKAREHELPLVIRTHEDKSPRDVGRKECEPYSSWHRKSFPTCNTVHEIDFPSGVSRGGGRGKGKAKGNGGGDGGKETQMPSENDDGSDDDGLLRIEFLSNGGSRAGWVMHTGDDASGLSPALNGTTAGNNDYFDRPLVFKTLRWTKEYREIMFEHQRKDALMTERLTSSPHVINIQAYCGESVVNDYADGGDLKHYVLRNTERLSSIDRLVLARDAALALADVHGIDGEGALTSAVHHDVKLYNMLIVNGKLRVHDFNNAQFLLWDRKKDERCGFSFKGTCTRKLPAEIIPPEECVTPPRKYSEKLEVYRLGLIMFFLLTDLHPGFIFAPPEMTERIVLGNPPALPRHLRESDDPATIALIRAMNEVLTYEVDKRPTARSIADSLVAATLRIE